MLHESTDPALPQPTPTESHHPDVLGLVMRDLQERAKAGEQKYGTLLRPFNGREALIDAYQEAMDLVMYLRQKIYEEGTPPSSPFLPEEAITTLDEKGTIRRVQMGGWWVSFWLLEMGLHISVYPVSKAPEYAPFQGTLVLPLLPDK